MTDESDRKVVVYPVGFFATGITLKPARSVQDEGVGRYPAEVIPFVYNVMRFAQERFVLLFSMVQGAPVKIHDIHALGPALIERVVFGNDELYDSGLHPHEDGKLFLSPQSVLQARHVLLVQMRCLPDLFMLRVDDDAWGKGSEVEYISPDVQREKFLRRTGLSP